MASNIMNEYIKLIKQHITKYMKLILKNKFDNGMFEEFWKSYLNTRYYNLNGYKSDSSLKTEVLFELENKKEELIEKDHTKKEQIENMYIFYTLIMYFDKVTPNKDLEKTIDELDDKKRELLGDSEIDFKENLRLTLSENIKQINELIEKYETTDFNLSITNYKKTKNVYRVNLKYNFNLPRIYSNFAIDKAFTTGTVNEDKLFIKYYLIVIQIIQDVIRGNFKKQYVIEIADTLFKKYQKMKRLLGIIENQVVQDKLNIKIPYKLFLDNKEEIYRLIKRGFRFAIIIDETFENSVATIEKLNIFNFIIINENDKWYHHIIEQIDSQKVIEV